jgi:tripeptide aminopeptidase
MKNAVDIAAEFMNALPKNEKPQYTEGTQGFFHMISCSAVCENAALSLIIRDFDAEAFAAREALLYEIAETLNKLYGPDTVTVTITEQYRNMKEVLDTVPHLTERLKAAISASGLTPVCEPFRGGTDGSALTFRGLPCPNLSAGYENAHGRFEYVPIQSMVKNVEILLNLVKLST